MDRYDYIKERLENMTASELIEIHNEYCYNNYFYEDEIKDMCLFNEECQNMKPLEIADRIYDGDFNPTNNYFCYHNGNFVSFDYSSDDNCPIDFDDLAQYIDNNDEDFNTGILEDYNDEYGEEEEE